MTPDYVLTTENKYLALLNFDSSIFVDPYQNLTFNLEEVNILRVLFEYREHENKVYKSKIRILEEKEGKKQDHNTSEQRNVDKDKKGKNQTDLDSEQKLVFVIGSLGILLIVLFVVSRTLSFNSKSNKSEKLDQGNKSDVSINQSSSQKKKQKRN